MENETKALKKGVGTGILIGILLSAVAIVVGVKTFCFVTGNVIVLGQKKVSSVRYSNILDRDTVKKVDEISQYLDVYYYDALDADEVQDALISGMVSGVGDVYTSYYTPKEYADLLINTTGKYYGIGAGLSQDIKTMVVTVTKIYEGTPAEESGLLKDDIIISVDGIDATSMELSNLVQLIRGEEGTTVHLNIYRQATKEELEFDVPRRNVQLPSVEGEMLEHGIGYIQISEFQTNTQEQFLSFVQSFEENDLKGLIVDLRDNPGGQLKAVVDILDDILPEGTVVYTEDKYGNQDVYSSDSACMDYPMVVLINGNSASASEIFAGAIKDYEYGTLIGTTSFGKGIVQTVFPLQDKDALKVTTAKYFTPKGYNIHGIGIEPDIELEYEFLGPEDATMYEKQYDNQLLKAIEVMNEKLAQ